MNTYAIFYDGQIDEIFEATEELAKQKFDEVLEIETQDGNQLYNTIELFELKKVSEYKYVLPDDEFEIKQ